MNTEVQEIRLDTYPAYKDSGVEWVGKIPKHWEVKKLGTILNPVSRKNHPRETLLSITREKGVIIRDIENEDDNHNFIPEDLTGYKLLKRGQFGMNKMKAWQGSYGVSDFNGIVSPAYYTFEFTKEINPRFFHLAIRSKLYVSYFGQASDGVRIGQWDLSKGRMKQIPFATPPLLEQTAIANFLDDKCAKIDAAVEIKQQQIALLKERRQIAIHKAVTQGLDKNVPMKDSGVEWVGEIPEHWEVKKIKNVTSKVGSGITPSGGGTIYLESGIPLLRSQNIHFDGINLDGVAYISEKIHWSMNNSQVFKGDVLLNITGGSIGRCYFVDFDMLLNVNQHVCILRPNNKITTYYLYSLLSSEIGQNQIWYHQQGGGREGLNFQALRNFSITYPPLQEQKEISTYIETITQKINSTISLYKQEIEKLKEYKTALINSAVTGKIKVPGVN